MAFVERGLGLVIPPSLRCSGPAGRSARVDWLERVDPLLVLSCRRWSGSLDKDIHIEIVSTARVGVGHALFLKRFAGTSWPTQRSCSEISPAGPVKPTEQHPKPPRGLPARLSC